MIAAVFIKRITTIRMRWLVPVAVGVWMISCGVKKPTYESADEIRRSVDELYLDYLTNDIASAKKDMEKSIDILLSNTNNPAIRVSDGLWFAYARLYVIENKLRNTNRAAQVFNAARSWYIEEQMWRLKHTQHSMERVKGNVELFTEEKCEDMVEEWDERHTDGVGAAYMK